MAALIIDSISWASIGIPDFSFYPRPSGPLSGLKRFNLARMAFWVTPSRTILGVRSQQGPAATRAQKADNHEITRPRPSDHDHGKSAAGTRFRRRSRDCRVDRCPHTEGSELSRGQLSAAQGCEYGAAFAQRAGDTLSLQGRCELFLH